MITIEQINGYNVAHIEANGYTASVMYEPNTTPLRPFQTEEELRAFAQGIEDDFNSREPFVPSEVVEETPTDRKEWRPDLFWRRFTPEEQAILLEASKSDPVVDSFKMNLMMTPVVQSDDPITIMGMDYIALKGYVTETRKKEILGGE